MTEPQNKLPLCVALVAVIFSLSACGPVKKELGIERNSPDEFMVIKRAPLTVPPDYMLRPPANAGEADPAAETAGSARTALLGESKNLAAKNASDSALLDKIGAATASPDIRRQIDEDNGYISLENRSVADRLIFWNDEPPVLESAPASVIDPKAEAERLKKNKAAGKPITYGTVPVIEKKSGTLDKIF